MGPTVTMDSWEEYLYRPYRRGEVEAWARRLKYFRFCRALGGHANDGDRLLVAFRLEESKASSALRSALGLPRDSLLRRFFMLTPDVNGWRKVFGASAFVWIYPDRLTISMMGRGGDLYHVSSADVEEAARVEEHLTQFSALVLDPPEDDKYCISPKRYPQIWREES